ncbi:MAG: hypothetical protein QT05_C0006G0022 [archaeon GW2011_AR13]|nr:MAG: hypothetical protein QT05_C0006G0022 [archaeon GW2011_AR13]
MDEKVQLEKELSSLMEMTLRLENELSFLVLKK